MCRCGDEILISKERPNNATSILVISMLHILFVMNLTMFENVINDGDSFLFKKLRRKPETTSGWKKIITFPTDTTYYFLLLTF